ncbi:response regulator transcription factor [Gordonia caeni]|uniref:Response regulator transcription factor n=1 Tax=Gordonia caeni TaxID=1007097 RepID=A0ABP7P6L0_9ACTN
MTEPLRVLIVEDSVLLREGLTRLLDEAGYLTVGALGDAVGLEEQVARARPDVVVLDVRLPPDFRDEGLRAARALRARSPEIGVLVLSQYVETLYAAELLSGGTGGVGYLLKDRVASLDELREAIERVHIGGTVLDPQVVAAMLTARTDPLSTLTPREREVLDVMTQGRTNRAIAEQLVIGVGAVEKHVTSIFAKLGLPVSDDDHRRVLAVLRYLDVAR